MRIVLQRAALLIATMATGMMAGVFALYSHTIMPGLGTTDDRTFVGAFQAIDRAILNPWFLPTFVGALLFSALAAALHVRTEDRAVLRWVGVALALYAVAFVVTIAVHVPLNDAIKAAGDPDRIANLAAVRAQFDEARWARFNFVRTGTSLAAFACLVWAALVKSGGSSDPQ